MKSFEKATPYCCSTTLLFLTYLFLSLKLFLCSDSTHICLLILEFGSFLIFLFMIYWVGSFPLYVSWTHRNTHHSSMSFVCVSRSAHRWWIPLWPRRPIRARFLCSVPLAVVSMATLGLMACALCVIKSTCQDRTMESVLWVLWVRPAVTLTVLFCCPCMSNKHPILGVCL